MRLRFYSHIANLWHRRLRAPHPWLKSKKRYALIFDYNLNLFLTKQHWVAANIVATQFRLEGGLLAASYTLYYRGMGVKKIVVGWLAVLHRGRTDREPSNTTYYQPTT